MITGNIFNIGSGHNKDEKNNTIAELGRSATAMDGRAGQKTFINNGPPTAFPEGFLKDRLRETLKWIEDNQITKINMAGHSRGAYLCNMIAEGVATSDSLKDQVQEINIINLDPVKMAMLDNCTITTQRKIQRYHVIIMLHEGKNQLFPLHIAQAKEDSDYHRRYTIPMPGKHGSGTQPLTCPIGKAVYEMIKKFMSNRGTVFKDKLCAPIDFCVLFAKIHTLQPLDADGRRKIFDDDRNAVSHIPGQHEEYLSESKKRAKVYAQLRELDTKYSDKRTKVISQAPTCVGGKPVDEDLLPKYFFNLQHLRYFYKGFPHMFNRMRTGQIADLKTYQYEVTRFNSIPTLRNTAGLLESIMPNKSLMP